MSSGDKHLSADFLNMDERSNEFKPLTREEYTLKSSQYQSLLLQFVHPAVRKDLQRGRIVTVVDEDNETVVGTPEETLEGMDYLRLKVLPPISPSDDARRRNAAEATACLSKLIWRSTEKFVFATSSEARCFSFQTWADLMDSMLASDYWSGVPLGSLDLMYLTVSEDIFKNFGKASPEGKQEYPMIPGEEKPVIFKATSSPTRPLPIPNSATSFVDPPRGTGRVQDVICLSDSSEDSICSAASLMVQPLTAFSSEVAGSVRKEVVRPPAFEMNGWQSFSQFLQSYERYFSARYVGSERDCTMHLVEFLPVKMQEYYHVIGGSRLRYSQMKEELQRWYRSQEKHSARHWRSQLMTETMNEGESLKVYGLRMMEISTRAYPHDEGNRLRELRHRYLETVPADFARHLQITQDASRLAGNQSKLGWTDILRLAEKEDERKRKGRKASRDSNEQGENPRVWFSRDDTSNQHCPSTPVNSHVCCSSSSHPHVYCASSVRAPSAAPLHASVGRDTSEAFSPQQQESASRRPNQSYTPSYPRSTPHSPPAQNRTRDLPPCTWCGRYGHGENSCWEREGRCLLCGSDSHNIYGCPRHRGQYPGGAPICPVCRGPHLGKACPTSPSRSRDF